MDPKQYKNTIKQYHVKFLKEFENDYQNLLQWFPQTVHWDSFESQLLIDASERIPDTLYAYHSLILSTDSFEDAIPLLEEIETYRLGNYKGYEGIIADIIPCFLNLLLKIRKHQMLKIYLPQEIKIMETALDKYKTSQIHHMVDNLVSSIPN